MLISFCKRLFFNNKRKERLINEEYVLDDNRLLEVRSDRLFHDLFNEHEMETLEWTVMMILEKPYEEIHENVSVGNVRLINWYRKKEEGYGKKESKVKKY